MDFTLGSTEIKLLESIGLIIVLLLIRAIFLKIVHARFSTAEFTIERKRIVNKALNLGFITILCLVLTGIWGLDQQQVLAFITSVLAVLGVGFFAQWSLLSNITSGIILYFNHPLKIGDHITIIDKDFPLTGVVEDISLFFLHIRTDEMVVYTIPNSAVIQKTLTINKKAQHGKESTNNNNFLD